MSIRRRLISAVCLVSLGLPVSQGQEKNPFADWDRIQKKSEVAPLPEALKGPAAAKRNGQVSYYSPSDAGAASELKSGGSVPAAKKAEGAPVLRERMKTAKKVAPEVSSGWPAAFQVHSSGDNGSGASGKAADRTVTQAAFEQDGTEESAITPVSAVESPATGAAEGNPFAELLKSAEQSKTAATADLSNNAKAEPANSARRSSPRSSVPATTKSSDSSSFVETTDEDAGVQAPGVTVEWVRHGELNVGQPGNVELVVHNTSKSTIRSVMAEAVIPAELEVVSVDPQPLSGTSAPSWTFGELKSGEKRSVSMQVIPRQRGDLRMNAFVRLTGHTSSSFAVQEPMIDVAVEGPEQIEVGQQVTYVVRVSNPGTGLASNVLIQAAIPDGLEHRRGSLLTIEVGTLSPGESRTAQLSVSAIKGGTHQMAVRAVADGGLTDQTMTPVSIAEPRLNLQITGPAEQMAGRTENYSLKVMNEGGVPSANVRAKYRVPEGFEFVRADRGGKYNEVDRSIEWFVGTIQPGESSAFQVSMKAGETGKLLHQAGVISEHGRVTMAEHSTMVEGTAALELKIAANRSDLKVGDEAAYEIRVTNTGSKSASNVGMSCELPSGFELIQAAGPSDHIAEHGVMVFKSLPQIEPGKSAVFAVKVRCTREGTHRLRLRVASESINEPLIGEEASTVSGR